MQLAWGRTGSSPAAGSPRLPGGLVSGREHLTRVLSVSWTQRTDFPSLGSVGRWERLWSGQPERDWGTAAPQKTEVGRTRKALCRASLPAWLLHGSSRSSSPILWLGDLTAAARDGAMATWRSAECSLTLLAACLHRKAPAVSASLRDLRTGCAILPAPRDPRRSSWLVPAGTQPWLHPSSCESVQL